ncbi:ComEA family DNA-binding protein [Thalassolituus sp. C2-1]|uniref:ComEA family DNA-binding protein n=1 Tax=Venatorbacter sp. C2-1 TaxID=2597518 RepID=UPI0011942F4E|nr:ComEA family DNA-binding protein [Thalassolituus sp. C2-1]TVV43323.1 helix-hairpin-helix domain-containing protein [Thalassolituus sp. C2-1]
MQWIKHALFSVCLILGTLSVQAAETSKPDGNRVKAVNINTATAEQLSQLDGIGKAKAEAIIVYRQQHGQFKSLDDITQVKGIGKAILDKNRSMLALE